MTDRADPMHRCPVCGEALSLYSYGTSRLLGGLPSPLEFRRCRTCQTVAWREQDTVKWIPVDEAALPADARFLISKL